MDAPVLLLRRLVADALEWNADLDLVAARGDVAFRLEDVVGIEVGRLAALRQATEAATGSARALRQGAIQLDAQRVSTKHERLAAIVIGAEEDDDVVV